MAATVMMRDKYRATSPTRREQSQLPILQLFALALLVRLSLRLWRPCPLVALELALTLMLVSLLTTPAGVAMAREEQRERDAEIKSESGGERGQPLAPWGISRLSEGLAVAMRALCRHFPPRDGYTAAMQGQPARVLAATASEMGLKCADDPGQAHAWADLLACLLLKCLPSASLGSLTVSAQASLVQVAG
ncbi:hypothetical protein F4678DRAFT_486926 [Xylaria arbuscula]|nr:hypothetical protein F4678DRAFT_486926 [Xylaria arbuscula]